MLKNSQKSKRKNAVKFGNGIGSELRRIRKEKQIRLNELAEQSDLDVVYLDLIERNKKDISLETILKILNVLNCSVLDFSEYRIDF